MTVQITSDQATDGGAAGVLAEVRGVFNSGRTRSLQWRAEQLRAIEKMCEESEPRSRRRWPVIWVAPPSRPGSATWPRPRPRRPSPVST